MVLSSVVLFNTCINSPGRYVLRHSMRLSGLTQHAQSYREKLAELGLEPRSVQLPSLFFSSYQTKEKTHMHTIKDPIELIPSD